MRKNTAPGKQKRGDRSGVSATPIGRWTGIGIRGIVTFYSQPGTVTVNGNRPQVQPSQARAQAHTGTHRPEHPCGPYRGPHGAEQHGMSTLDPLMAMARSASACPCWW